MANINDRYLRAVLDPIRICAGYRPKFGLGAKTEGLSLLQFQRLYQADPFYHWLGLDNPLMYAAHKAAGGMTSVYRQIGIGCEKLFRLILIDALGLDEADVAWAYEVSLANGKRRKLALDARVPLDSIPDPMRRNRFHSWMWDCSQKLSIDSKIFEALGGTVFEVRQGYKSKDSKRQNADIANAAAAYTKAYFPCAIVLSTQFDSDLLSRYRAEKWGILTGICGAGDARISTYDFMRDVVGFDLADFFDRNRSALRSELDAVLRALLAAEAK